jgi:hypothetical protein
MVEEWWRLWIGPAAPIVGALVGALIAALVTYFLIVKRKRLSIFVGRTEDLTKGLRAHRHPVALRFGDKEVKRLNRAWISITNKGNTTISAVELDVVIPGLHEVSAGSVQAFDSKLEGSIKLTERELEFDKTYRVSVPFLNAKESFDVIVYFDGDADRCEVMCRMEDVQTRIVREKPSRLISSGHPPA